LKLPPVSIAIRSCQEGFLEAMTPSPQRELWLPPVSIINERPRISQYGQISLTYYPMQAQATVAQVKRTGGHKRS